MTELAKKHIIFFSAWFVCMGFILLLNFSWFALGLLVVLGGISLYKNVLRKEEKLAKYLTYNIRYYILMSTLFAEGVYIINCRMGFTLRAFTEEIDDRFIAARENVADFLGQRIPLVLILAVVTIICMLIRKKFVDYPFIHTVMEYIFWGVLLSVLVYALTQNLQAFIAYIICALIYIMGDVLRKVYTEEGMLGTKAGKRCFVFFSVILIALMIVNPIAHEQLMNFRLMWLVELFGSWSVFLVLFIVTVAALVLTCLVDSSMFGGSAYEKYVLIGIASMLPVIFVSAKVYTAYRGAILIAYFVYVLLAATRMGPNNANAKRYYVITDLLPLPIVSATVIFLVIEARYGKLLLAAVLVFSTAIAARIVKCLLDIDNTAKQFAYATATAIIWLYVNTLTRLAHFHRHFVPIIVISVVTVVFLVVVCAINRNPDIYQSNSLVTKGQVILPLLLLVVALTSFVQGGSNIKLETEGDDEVRIEVSADGKNNSIVDAKYCQLDSLGAVVRDIYNDEETEYTFFRDDTRVEIEKGLLKIVVEDEYGVKTTKKIWYSGKD